VLDLLRNVLAAFVRLFAPRAVVAAENLLLRHQLIVLRRSSPRPRLRRLDRCLDDLRKITAPTLILVGDRDRFCTVEEGVTAYRKLQRGELSVLPDVGHSIPVSAIDATLAFLLRQRRVAGRSGPGSS
jgi:pimeloyl-ACP methyl ester carboxylesterase